MISIVAAQALREVAIRLLLEISSFESSCAKGDRSKIEATWRSVCANFSSSLTASLDQGSV